MNTINTKWPKCFDDNNLIKTMSKDEAVANVCLAWANCYLGNKPHEKFGETLVAISQQFKIRATPDHVGESL